MSWSQRRTHVTLLVDERVSVELVDRDEEAGTYEAIRVRCGDKDAVTIHLFAPIVELSEIGIGNNTSRVIRLTKADPCAEFWQTLASRDACCDAFVVKIDWGRWIDEDYDVLDNR